MLCTFSTAQFPKVVRRWGFFSFFTCKCASCHNSVHFFDIWTSKTGPNFGVFNILTSKRASRRNCVHFFGSTSKSGPMLSNGVHFFRQLNFQKWSEAEVFCTFWLRNVLRATTACTFSTSQLPKVVRRWGVLYIVTWKCASRHNGVQFFISHLASWLRTASASLLFDPPEPSHWKHTVFRDFPTFSRICIFFLLTLSLLWSSLFYSSLFSLPLPCSAFHLSILSEVWLLNFLRSYIPNKHSVCSLQSLISLLLLSSLTSYRPFVYWIQVCPWTGMGDYVSVVGSCPEYLDSITGTGCMHDDSPGSEPHEFSWQFPICRARHTI